MFCDRPLPTNCSRTAGNHGDDMITPFQAPYVLTYQEKYRHNLYATYSAFFRQPLKIDSWRNMSNNVCNAFVGSVHLVLMSHILAHKNPLKVVKFCEEKDAGLLDYN